MSGPEDYLSRAEPRPTDPALDARIRRAIAGERLPSPRSRIPALAAAAALLLAFCLWRAFRPAPVRTEEVLQTSYGQTRDLTLADGSRLTLGPRSRLRLGPGRPALAAFLEEGTLDCRVAHGGGAFRIGTPLGEAVAMGTEFRVTSDRGEKGGSTMTYASGRVIRQAALVSVAVTAGWVEFRAPGLLTAVHAAETLTAEEGKAPEVRPMTGGTAQGTSLTPCGRTRSTARTVSGLALSPDAKRLAVCVKDMAGGGKGEYSPEGVEVSLWDPKAGICLSRIPLDGIPSDLCWLSDGSLWVTEAMDNSLRRLDLERKAVAETRPLNAWKDKTLTSADARLFPSPDGKRVLVTGFNTAKALYAVPGWTEPRMLEGPTDLLPTGGGWSPDGKSFVGAKLNDTVVVWDLEKGTSRSAGTGREPVFGPDGKPWALTPDFQAFGPSEGEGDARRWYSTDGAPLRSAAFSPDGKRLALGAADGSVVLKEADSGKTVKVFPYAAEVPQSSPDATSLLWAPDGSWVAVGRQDGSSAVLRMP